jgi:hypothetical protein
VIAGQTCVVPNQHTSILADVLRTAPYELGDGFNTNYELPIAQTAIAPNYKLPILQMAKKKDILVLCGIKFLAE